MNRILDSSFRYRPSFDTDVRKTIAAFRRKERGTKERAAESGGNVTALPILQTRRGQKAR